MEILKRHVLRKSDFRRLKEKLSLTIGSDSEELFEKGAELVTTDQGILYAENKVILAFEKNELILPSLKALNDGRAKLPTVTVDMGAVPFVTNGADIMAPGITEITAGLMKETFIVIVDENYGKSLAVGQLLVDSDIILEKKKGKVIKNLHYVNDAIWSLNL